jgi:hypothetical protein
MTKLIIHSGAYKTGSTSIQHFLKREAPRLLSSQGILYPMSGRGKRAQHNNLVAELKQQRNFNPALGGWSDVFAETAEKKAEVAIVSSEHFSTLLPHEIARLRSVLSATGLTVVWVHYVREQASLVNALYVERIVTMRPEFLDRIDRPFEEFLTWSPIPLDFLDYDAYERSIVEELRDVEVIVRPFVREALAGGDAVADFCALLDAGAVPDSASRVNVGAGWRTVEVARRLTRLVAESPIARQPTTPAGFQARLGRIGRVRSRLMEITRDLGWNDESAIYATGDFARSVAEQYARSNAELGARLGIDLNDLFARQPMRPRNVGDFSEIASDDLFSVVHHVLPSLFWQNPGRDRAATSDVDQDLVRDRPRSVSWHRFRRRLRASLRRPATVDDTTLPAS